MRILLDDKGIAREMGLPYPLKEEMEHENYAVVDINDLRPLVKATGKKIADAIDSMTADGWWLEDIVKAIRKEAE